MAAAAAESRLRGSLRPFFRRPVPPRHQVPSLAPRQGASSVHVRPARPARRPRRSGREPSRAMKREERGSEARALRVLDSIQRRVLWLSTWMVHRANARPGGDGTKVGGHQASSASVVSLLTALYFGALGPDDVVAVKAHASPAFYAIQYLRGRLRAADLEALRDFEGLQAYPSRRKNPGVIDLSTGSLGLGAVAATFGALATRYIADHPALMTG